MILRCAIHRKYFPGSCRTIFSNSASGQIYHKESVISALAAENVGAWAEMANDGYELRPLAKGVVLLTYSHVRTREGVPDARSLRSSIWMLIGDRWQLVFHQGTPTRAE
ncbi:nuclear transport factor 2 family protein [Phenylobacterium montanum]|uniref:Nuclear transport factor 2 family protein n=1 Tax=Phenylobacterium montanum TaxID=2823693 RepID=A0A975G4B1_9CAUL|nr:nuclear transport factor 2 family protein [Caulobacter sp. S6]